MVVELHEEIPDGPLVHTCSFSPEIVSGSWDWFIIDCSGILMDMEKTYCIVVPSPHCKVDTSFGYEWGCIFKDVYREGSFLFTRDGRNLWRDLPDKYELTFRTYGYSLP